MKKNKLILLQLAIAFMLICTSVYATVSTTISVSTSSTSVKRGEEITVTLSLDDVDSNKKVESVEGYINYDENILEKVTVDSIEQSSTNTVTIEDETLTIEDVTNGNVQSTDSYVAFNSFPSSDNDIKIVIDFKDGITADTDLLKIKFKVKSDADLGTVTNAISYGTFQITAGNETGADITKNINLTVVSDSTNDDTNNTVNNTVNNTTNNTAKNNTVNNVTNNTTKNNTVNNATKNTNNTNKTNTNTNKTNTNTNKTNTNNTNTNDTTVAGTTLPATGSKIVVLPAIVLIALAYVSYNKYMKYKNI